MRCRALTCFVSETGTYHYGDKVEMDDNLAAIRIAAGLVEEFVEEPRSEVEEAVKPEAEQAVIRKRRR